ncbi:MAG: glucose-1-phosphate thymidylyltransferase [Actinomycetota bacterium]
MKAIIPAGGAGTRLRPITHTSAKQLVPVANKPILFYALEAIADAGIVEVGLIVGDTADEMRGAVGTGERWGLKVTYIPQDEPRGLAHCVLIAREFLGDDDFVMYLGDNLLGEGVTEFVRLFEEEGAAARILLVRVPDPQHFGVAELDGDGTVVRLVEKPKSPPSDLALVGVYLFNAAIHEAVRAIQPSWRDELEITDAIQWLIDQGHPVRSQVVAGYWKDTGQVEALLEGNRLVLESVEPAIEGMVDDESRLVGRVVVQPGAEVVRSIIRGPAIIGEGTRVVDSFIGPFTSVYYGCEILRSEIEHSIVLEQSRIVDMARIADSLIGKQVEVCRSRSRPQAHRLILGDHSRVDLV